MGCDANDTGLLSILSTRVGQWFGYSEDDALTPSELPEQE